MASKARSRRVVSQAAGTCSGATGPGSGDTAVRESIIDARGRNPVDEKLAGVSESSITGQVVSIARCLGPSTLRSLNSIHLAPPNLMNSNVVCAFDKRLFITASEFGFRTKSPGWGDSQS